MRPIRLTQHFALHEWEQPARHGFPVAAYPMQWIFDRLIPLAKFMEVGRERLGGHPWTIVSGYRTHEYNARIGGAEDSQHMHGRAADIVVQDIPPGQVFELMRELDRSGEIRFGGLGLYVGFVHIDIRPRKDHQNLVIWTGSRTREQTEGGVVL